MKRRGVLGLGMALFGLGGAVRAAPSKDWPPVPKWRPSFGQPLDQVVDRLRYYTDQKRDFAVFTNGTCALLNPGLDDSGAKAAALEIMSKVFHAHPDLTPLHMDDGNLMVRYSQPELVTVVLTKVVRAHRDEIERHHQDGLARDEVLITPLGQNVFDETGKAALYGRALMFMDAQTPKIVRIERRSA